MGHETLFFGRVVVRPTGEGRRSQTGTTELTLLSILRSYESFPPDKRGTVGRTGSVGQTRDKGLEVRRRDYFGPLRGDKPLGHETAERVRPVIVSGSLVGSPSSGLMGLGLHGPGLSLREGWTDAKH